MTSNHTCPECHLIFDAEPPVNGALVCPLCNSAFSVQTPDAPAPLAAPLPAASGRQILRGVVAVGAFLFLALGLCYAYHLMEGIGPKAAIVPPPTTSATSQAETPRPVSIAPVPPVERKPQEPILKPKPVPKPAEPQPPLLVKEKSRPLSLPERVNRAIDRGLAHLTAHHAEHNQYRIYLGLLGLTLLECGIPADKPPIQQIAAWIRSRERDLTTTYELTLAILFLDRLGEERDHALIRSYGQRLLSGQSECGAWTYWCLLNNQRRPLDRSSDELPAILSPRHWPNAPPARGGRQRIVYQGDNSNTQFALLGLWVAQRHGVPARSALLAAEQYFRTTQHTDGSWSYEPHLPRWRDAMTCAGLMSLAMRYGVVGDQGRGIRPEQPIQVHDAAITRGLRFLEQTPNKISLINGRIIGVDSRFPLYFLWSLERMAVIYDLKKIGEREWYPWAAELLVQAQDPDGHWPSSDPVDTCFALLILKRSNFAKDLKLALKDPSSRPLPTLTGPAIFQGRDALLEQIGKPQGPITLPRAIVPPRALPSLGPSISRTPNTK